MNYNFDEVLQRKGTGSIKWDLRASLYGSEDVLPLWVADMDFAAPKPVLDAVRERLKHPVLGYSMAQDSLKESIQQRMKRLFGWEIEKEWILFMPGVVPSMYTAVAAFTNTGDGVLVQSPVYPPFFDVIKEQNRKAVINTLAYDKDNGHGIDMDDFVQKCRGQKLFLLCSPHNPGGRVWSKNELNAMAGHVCGAGGVIVSDEIHHEIVYPGSEHIPVAAMSREIGEQTITCVAPSKTFNIAGLSVSAVIIQNAGLRRKFRNAQTHGTPWPNVLGLAAFEAAYSEGDEWLAQILEYLQQNRDFVHDTVNRFAGISEISPDGTFLSWLDCRELIQDGVDIEKFFAYTAKVGLNSGSSFGPGGEGFMRLNFACARSTLAEALSRIEDALSRL